ncbi:MAG: hypothetical protein KA761_08390 [Gemmatimonadaceae bacterium]|nr:hypothetical protein [Gemmatimonadaceae bacterium]
MLRLTTLGVIDLRDHLGRPVREVLAQPKRIALLIHLVVEGRAGPVPRDRLLAMFWPESDEARARNALSQALHHLRQAIGPDVIVGTGPSLGIAPDRLWCDAVVFEDALAAGDAELALDIHKGEFAPALFVTGAGELEQWISGTRRDQRRRLLELVRRGVARAASAGDAAGAAGLARRALALVPDDEHDVREYLAAVEGSGDATGALALFAEYSRRIAADIDSEPEPETEALVEAIRRRRSDRAAREPVLVSAPPPPTPATVESALPSPITSHGPEADAPRGGRARRALLLAAIACVVLASGLAVRSLRASADGSAAHGATPSAIAVFPFTVRGGDTAAMLGEGLTDLLSAKLQGLDEVRAIDPRSSIAAAEGRTPDPARADLLSQTLGARYFVLGGLVERAGHLELDGALYETGRSAMPRATASVGGDTTAIFSLVDELAGRLLANLIGGRDTALTSLASVTTSSLPALKAYLRGERALRDGLDARAAAAFREAAQLDTTFALAQYRLSLVANWVIVPGIEDPSEMAALAARHGERLSPLGRDLLQAYRAYKTPSATTLPLYRAIVKSYPDNVEAWYMLGEAIFHYGPLVGEAIEGAREPFERALRLDPANAHAQLHLARVLARSGAGPELEALVGKLLSEYSDADRALELRALLAWTRRDSDASTRIIEEARGVDEIVAYGLVQAGTTYALDLPAARAIARNARRSLTNRFMRTYMEVMIGQTDLGLGRWEQPTVQPGEADERARLEAEVLASVEPMLGVPKDRLRVLRARIAADHPYAPLAPAGMSLPAVAGVAMRHHLLALLDLRLGDSVRARAHADSITALAAAPERAQVRSLASSTRAEFLRVAGRNAEALAELERFPFDQFADRYLLSGSRERFARAELLRALGREAEARAWYGTFPAFYDLALLAPARLRIAQLEERAGRADEARRGYEDVLTLWHDADTGLQRVTREAREGLRRLEPR